MHLMLAHIVCRADVILWPRLWQDQRTSLQSLSLYLESLSHGTSDQTFSGGSLPGILRAGCWELPAHVKVYLVSSLPKLESNSSIRMTWVNKAIHCQTGYWYKGYPGDKGCALHGKSGRCLARNSRLRPEPLLLVPPVESPVLMDFLPGSTRLKTMQRSSEDPTKPFSW